MQVKVEGIAQLEHGEARVFAFEREGETREGFVLRVVDELVAYHNRCPHWGVDLDMGEGKFYSHLSERIFCSSHGALFAPKTGFCEAGPCVGDSLERFELQREGEDCVLVTIADQDPNPRW